MAKELSATDLAAALTAMGMPIPEELAEKVENAVSDEAFHYIVPRIVNVDDDDVNDTASEWQETLFSLAGNVRQTIKSEEKNRGQGRRIVHFLSVETPDGTLKVELSRAL